MATKPYRVTLPNGLSTTLMLKPETAERDFPDAVPVKTGPAPVVKDAPKAPRKRRTTAKKA